MSSGSRLNEASATHEGVRHPQDPPRGQGSARSSPRVRARCPAEPPPPPPPLEREGGDCVGQGAAEPRAPPRDLVHPGTQGDSVSPETTLGVPGAAPERTGAASRDPSYFWWTDWDGPRGQREPESCAWALAGLCSLCPAGTVLEFWGALRFSGVQLSPDPLQ